MENTNKSFCFKLWNELAISPTGTITPCCLFEDVLKDDNNVAFKSWEHSLLDVWNSNSIKKIRQKMLNGESVIECRQCYISEEHNGFSARLETNTLANVLYSKPNLTVESDRSPISLDLKLNNKCNLACRMCQPKDSSRIEDEFSKVISEHPEFEYFDNAAMEDPFTNLSLSEIPDWPATEHFYNQYLQILPNLESLNIAGGEPFLQDSFFKILQLAQDSGDAKHIRLKFTTNFTLFPAKKMFLFHEHFKQTIYIISLDAISDELSYIRYPSNWNKIKNNILALSNYIKERGVDVSEGSKIRIRFSITVQVYNILSLTDVFDFIEDLLADNEFLSSDITYLSNLMFPTHLNIATLPNSLRSVSANKLKMFQSSSIHMVKNSAFIDNVNKIISVLEHEVHPESLFYQKQFAYYTSILDLSRGESIQNSLPHIYNSYKEFFTHTVAEIDRTNYTNRKLGLFRSKGYMLASQNQYDKAIEMFKQAYILKKDQHLDLEQMAWMYNSIQMPEEALKCYIEAFEINSGSFIIARELGATFTYIKNKDLHQAEKYLKIALQLNPQDDTAKNLLDKVLSKI